MKKTQGISFSNVSFCKQNYCTVDSHLELK